MRYLLLGIINFYMRAISPLFPPHCRFYPSCSRYSFEAIAKYGVIKGALLSINRILRCHPFNAGGYDPLP